MDTSETYIKMCEKAEEIQKQKEAEGLEHGDYIYAKDGLDFWFHTGKVELLVGKPEYRYALLGVIFIPRIDQLQEMVPSKIGGNFWDVLIDLFKWINHKKWSDYVPRSMEQLWLAFGMFKKYNKVWTNNEWRNGNV